MPGIYKPSTWCCQRPQVEQNLLTREHACKNCGDVWEPAAPYQDLLTKLAVRMFVGGLVVGALLYHALH